MITVLLFTAQIPLVRLMVQKVVGEGLDQNAQMAHCDLNPQCQHMCFMCVHYILYVPMHIYTRKAINDTLNNLNSKWFPTVKEIPLHKSFLLPYHRPDITEILFKRT